MIIKNTKYGLVKYLMNGIWLPIPSLVLYWALANRLPVQFQADIFTEGIPDIVTYGEGIFRIAIYFTPLFFSIGISTTTQKQGMAWYIIGMTIYFLAWIPLIIAPNSVWSRSVVGFLAPAFTPLIWLIGIAMLGEKFCCSVRYHPIYYIGLSVIFIIFHCTHVTIVYLRNF